MLRKDLNRRLKVRVHRQCPTKDRSKNVTYADIHITSVSICCTNIVVMMQTIKECFPLLLTIIQKLTVIEMLRDHIS